MKVVIDIDALNHDSKSGVYYYQQRLVKELLKLGGQDYTLSYLGKPRPAAELGLPNDAPIRATSWLPRIIYSLSLRTPFGLPYDLVTGTRADLYIYMKFSRWPLWRRAKSIVFVHDTAYRDFPEVIENWYFRWYLNWTVPRSLKRASQIVVISESTKRSIMEYYGTPADKISVVTPAVDHDEFKPVEPAEVERVKQLFGIDQPYILSVSTIEPRKNLSGLLKACRQLPEGILSGYTLVLAGNKGWLDAEINQLYTDLQAHMKVVKTGFVEDADLPALFTGASVFAFPSLYEGFGIPPLEALACGVPVITANNSSLPEVVGEAGILVEATDTAALSQAIAHVLENPEEADRLRRAGLERAKMYNWSASAQRLLDVMNNLGAKK